MTIATIPAAWSARAARCCAGWAPPPCSSPGAATGWPSSTRPRPLHIPIYGSDEVADVTGAGDTVIATFTLALAAGASPGEASRLANYAGGIVVTKRGTATVSAAELKAAIAGDRGAA